MTNTGDQYITTCKLCGGQLALRSITYVNGPDIEGQGFDLSGGNDGSTADEMVVCKKCGVVRPLELNNWEREPSRRVENGFIILWDSKAKVAELLSEPSEPPRYEGYIAPATTPTDVYGQQTYRIVIYRDLGENPFALDHPEDFNARSTTLEDMIDRVKWDLIRRRHRCDSA